MPVRPKNDPLAARIREVRRQLGWNQERMAKHLDISRATLSGWEAYGPPARGPARKFVMLTLRRLKDVIRDRENAKETKPAVGDGL